MKQKAKVLIVDDQRSIRHMMKAVIDRLGGEVVGEAENGEEALAQCAALTPDLVLLDITMPKMTGVEALKQITVNHPSTAVIMLTSHNTIEMVQECLENGAKNFLLKSNPLPLICEELQSTWIEHVKARQEA